MESTYESLSTTYSKTKEKYLKYMLNCCNQTSNKMLYRHPIFKDNYNKIARSLRNASDLHARGQRLGTYRQRVFKFYSFAKENVFNERIIINKTGKELIACEDAFDILYKVHLETGHGKRVKMQAALEKYYIHRKCLKYLLSSCPICTNNPLQKKCLPLGQFNEICNAFVAYNPFNAYEEYQHILITVDKNTNFINIRPLLSIDVQEVAMELMKIFMDFGIPFRIAVHEQKFFKHVISAISKLFTNLSIPVENSDLRKDWTGIVTSNIKTWMEYNNTENWVMACHEVQYNMNNNGNDEVITAFQSVFKQKAPNDIILTKIEKINSLETQKAAELNDTYNYLQKPEENIISIISDSSNDSDVNKVTIDII